MLVESTNIFTGLAYYRKHNIWKFIIIIVANIKLLTPTDASSNFKSYDTVHPHSWPFLLIEACTDHILLYVGNDLPTMAGVLFPERDLPLLMYCVQ